MATNFDTAQKVRDALSIKETDGSQKDVVTVYNGDPNTYVTATKGALCIDYTNGGLYQNTDGSTAWSSISTSASLPVLMMRKNGNQSLSAGVNVVTGYTIDVDTHSGYSANKYYFPSSGKYIITANALSVNICGYRINGGTDLWMGGDSHGGGDSASGGGKLIIVTASDYIEFIVSSTGSDLYADDAYTFFSIFKLPDSSLSGIGQCVNARYNTTAGQSIPDTITTIVDFATQTHDTDGAVTTGSSWKFTAPSAGKYNVSCLIFWSQSFSFTAGQSVQTSLYKNGTFYSLLDILEVPLTGTQYVPNRGSDTVHLNQGDYIDVRVYQNTGSSVSLDTSAGFNYICIDKVGN